MVSTPTNSSTFPLFSRLPLELRDQIWRDALPENVGPALYPYRKGCWCPRRLSKSDKGYDSENDENNLNLEFRHDFLYDIHFELPLVSVNREARALALAWAREQGVTKRPRDDGRAPVFVRSFDPMRDALHVSLDKWDDFLSEPDDRLFEPDLSGQLVDIKSDIRRIAVPEALLRNELTSVAWLADIFQYFFNVNVLFVVVDPQPDLQSTDDDPRVQQRWEFEKTQGAAFIWDDERGGFDSEGSEDVGDDALHRLIEQTNEELGEELSKKSIHSFEIRPVFAVRR